MPRTPLPEPIAKEGGHNFWFKRQYREYVALLAGLPSPPPAADDEDLITANQFREKLGGVSHMWLDRRRAKNIEKERAKRNSSESVG